MFPFSPADVKTGILKATGIVKSEEEEEIVSVTCIFIPICILSWPPDLIISILSTTLPFQAHEMVGTFSPFGRSAEAKEVGEVILFLASSAASYISGQDLMIDAANSLTSVSTCNSLMGGEDWKNLEVDA